LDEDLTRRFEELTDVGNVPFGPTENREVFSIKKVKDEKIKYEKEKQEEIKSALNKREKNNKPPSNAITTGGSVIRKTKSKTKSKVSMKRTQKRYK